MWLIPLITRGISMSGAVGFGLCEVEWVGGADQLEGGGGGGGGGGQQLGGDGVGLGGEVDLVAGQGAKVVQQAAEAVHRCVVGELAAGGLGGRVGRALGGGDRVGALGWGLVGEAQRRQRVAQVR